MIGRFVRRLFLWVALFVAGVVLWFSGARAASLEERFRQFDSNADGVLSGDELAASPVLPRLDTNQDGQVTRIEALKAFANAARQRKSERADASPRPGQKTADVFTSLDRDADGALTPKELPDSNWFERLDGNRDNSVTLDEALQTLGDVFTGTPPRSAAETAAVASLAESPQVLKGTEHGIGSLVNDVSLQALDGQTHSLRALAGKQGLLVGLFSPSCPLSQKLAPEMRRLEESLPSQGINVVWLAAMPSITADRAQKFAQDFSLHARIVLDPDATFIRHLRATTTTEVFLLDAASTLAYRGAIHDQYGLNYAKNQADRHFVNEAVAALLASTPPAVTATSAPGCALDEQLVHSASPAKPAALPATPPTVTYHQHISRILQNHCVECHREGGLGPFALDDPKSVIENAGMIRKQVERGAMPPWFAGPAHSGPHAVFANDTSLPAADKAALLAWLASPDRPLGDPASAPKPRVFPTEWSIGQPDVVFELPRSMTIQAEGTMPYQNVVIETHFPDDRWISAYEIMPTARQVVHHVIVRVHQKGEKIRGLGEGEGFWAAYVPGNSHRIYPDGFAKKLPAGARLSLQMHYTPVGREMQDRTRIALKFSKTPPAYEMRVTGLTNLRLRIPPGEPRHVETLERTLPADFFVTGFMPHMHMRGAAFKYDITLADGTSETLLDVPRYDFNWQLQYTYFQPRFFPAGSRMKITAVYDNSAANPANPDPTKTVRWGDQTWDEMMIGYIEHYRPVSPAAQTSAR